MATNKLRVELEGKDKSLGKTLRGGANDASTFHGKLKLIGQALKQLITGNFRGLGTTLKTLGNSFGGFGALATGAIAGIGVATVALVGFIWKAKAAYESWMGDLVKLQRIPGLAAKSASILAGTLRLVGVDAGKAQTGFGIFAKTLDGVREAVKKAQRPITGLDKSSKDYAETLAKLQQGVRDAEGPFQRLGISLKDAEGQWRPLAEVIADARDRLSEIRDPATRAGLAAKLFGKSYQDLLPWLTKGAEKIREYTKFTKSLGMEMGEKSIKAFKQYRENQRKLAFAWDAIKVNAYAALVPLINKYMPDIIGVIQKAAGWMGRFRKLAEKKGLEKAMKEMAPWAADVYEAVRDAAGSLGSVVRQLESLLKWINTNGGTVRAFFQGLADAARALSMGSGLLNALGSGGGGGGSSGGTGKVKAMEGDSSTQTGKMPRKGALGAAVFAAASGEPWTLHGRETVVAHKDPMLGLRDLAGAGIIGSGGQTVVNVFLDSEPIAARVEVRQQQRARRAARTSGMAFA